MLCHLKDIPAKIEQKSIHNMKLLFEGLIKNKYAGRSPERILCLYSVRLVFLRLRQLSDRFSRGKEYCKSCQFTLTRTQLSIYVLFFFSSLQFDFDSCSFSFPLYSNESQGAEVMNYKGVIKLFLCCSTWFNQFIIPGILFLCTIILPLVPLSLVLHFLSCISLF